MEQLKGIGLGLVVAAATVVILGLVYRRLRRGTDISWPVLLAVGKVLDDETQEWATEFQNALKDLERARKTESETQRTGAIEISVRNPQMVTGWTLEIDGSQRGRSTGKTLAVSDVLVGLHKARAYGSDDQGRVLADERIIKVEGGTTVSRELELC